MARNALIETATGLVVNVIELEPGANWTPPVGQEVVDALDATEGSVWDGSSFSQPPEPPVPQRFLAEARLREVDLATLPPAVATVIDDILTFLSIRG